MVWGKGDFCRGLVMSLQRLLQQWRLLLRDSAGPPVESWALTEQQQWERPVVVRLQWLLACQC
jgi:hypothetical protein